MATRGRPRTFDPDTALRQALDLFWERGYEGTSLNDLAEAMGIASASIYACFGNKEDLFRQVMRLYSTTSGEPPRRALREQPTARAAVHAMLRATADQITGPDTPHYCMLVLAAPPAPWKTTRSASSWPTAGATSTPPSRTGSSVVSPPATSPWHPRGLDAVARYYATVVQGLSIQARDAATRAELESVITCAMAAWDTLTSAPASPGG